MVRAWYGEGGVEDCRTSHHRRGTTSHRSTTSHHPRDVVHLLWRARWSRSFVRSCIWSAMRGTFFLTICSDLIPLGCVCISMVEVLEACLECARHIWIGNVGNSSFFLFHFRTDSRGCFSQSGILVHREQFPKRLSDTSIEILFAFLSAFATNSARLVGPRARTPSARPSNFFGEIWLQIPSAREHQQQNDAIERQWSHHPFSHAAYPLEVVK